jgi:hypothetical protein
VAHIVAGAELTIGDIQEVGVADKLTQEVPCLAVDLVVSDIAVVGLGVNRDGSIRTDRDAEQQLLQIRSMILIIAEGDAWWTVALLGGLLVTVRSREGDGGGVVVQLLQVDLEFRW